MTDPRAPAADPVASGLIVIGDEVLNGGRLDKHLGAFKGMLQERFGALEMFSLPHIGEDPHILLGFRGRAGLDEAMVALRSELDQRAFRYRARDRG